jgi:hypothetical protein
MQEKGLGDPEGGAARAHRRDPGTGVGGVRAPGAAAPLLRGAACGTAAFLGVAAAWDVAGMAVDVPPWWPAVSHAMVAMGVAFACIAVLLRVLGRGRRAPAETARIGIELVAIGLVLLAWVLRGDPEVVPDPPLVAAHVVAVLVMAGVAALRWRSARAG